MWLGFETSIHEYQLGPLMCVDVGYRIVHNDNMLQEIKEMGSNQSEIRKNVTGQIVMTIYNQAPYRVSDVEFMSPMTSSFESKSGPMSYAQYYQEKYKLTVMEDQPMLIAKPANSKEKDCEVRLIPQF